MKGLIITGILLVVLGGAALVFQGITYSRDEQVLDIGPLEAEVEREKTIPLSPVLGGAALALGIGLIVYGMKKR
ncbi:DUF3185 domain-containing protein [Rhodothermaceae bacterium RA]|nr:DUF3185 domain-containing protein [Rhodothermaceae bacterium RA]